MDQFCTFCAAAVKFKAIERASMISVVATGAQGTPKGIQAAVKEITKENGIS